MFIMNMKDYSSHPERYFICDPQTARKLSRKGFNAVGSDDTNYYFVKTQDLMKFLKKRIWIKERRSL